MLYIRDYSMFVAIFGFFSMVWYGWAQEKPPVKWKKYIGIATGIATLFLLAGIYLSVNNWQQNTALSDDTSFNYYLIFVFIEFSLAALGAFLLLKYKKSDYVAPWVAFIVGVHFFALRYIFEDFSLHILAVLLIAVSISSLFLSRKYNVANSAITGIGSGTVLLLFVIYNLIRLL